MEISEKEIEEFFTLLRFQSVGKGSGESRSCAEWLRERLKEAGFAAELWETAGSPVLFGEKKCGEEGRPTLLLYNHYDVQPADPFEEWETPPFEPTLKEGTIYARGAQDNKGQLFYTLLALRELEKLPVNVKWLIEGEEESGSAGLEALLPEKRGRLKADCLAIVDGGIPSMKSPAVTLGARGIATFEVSVEGSKSDLHSGTYGGIVVNPLHALVAMLAALRDGAGKIRIPGFYDEVALLNAEERELIDFSFDKERFRQEFGAEPSGGEKTFSPRERATVRPTLEINGIFGGYAGEGFKTVIPAKAFAKLSCRLVADQDPQKISESAAAFLKQCAPEGVRIEVRPLHSGRPFRSNPKSGIVKAFAAAYEEVLQKRCRYMLEGGSVPVAAALAEAAGAETAMIGLGLPGDRIHAPNEHFSLDRLLAGKKIVASALCKLIRI